MRKEKYKKHYNNFLKVRDKLKEQRDFSSLAKAFKKPLKFYGNHTIQEAIKILKTKE